MSSDIVDPKADGDNCLKNKKYIEAMLHYTKATKIDPKNAKIYSNRSLAFLRLDQYFYALEDANKAIKLEPTWAKGYFRRGEVYFCTQHYKKALQSYQQGLDFDPNDKTLLNARQLASIKWDTLRTSEARIPVIGMIIGMIFGIAVVLFDHYLNQPSVIQNSVLKMIIAASFTALAYGVSLAYRGFNRSQRRGLLESPVDLFGTGDEPQEKPSVPPPNVRPKAKRS
ncbi:DgyrCDS8034 [Dimorphilus gyrociliatus]|uniref:DgyrCDS8034 n=1 Tax=Dimorphilus gyrociliatus TaxID=2664684 RepID=A0A7I8VSZ9_9ANNE|nr:DgyrCDS8034 [Dimorphilus gyrociliatus]